MADADASLVGTSSQQQRRGADSSDQVMHSASSPALSSTDNINAGIVDSSTGADICNNGQQQQQQQQQGSSPQNNAAN
ncbi:hypothetical protein GGI22_007731 [Coemansia erecta]|nr:hypothetical protein GGI22_007731 [Coemansia erecta]